MQLIGYLDSPFVRRVAISMRFLGIEYEHRELSIFRDFDEFRSINPTVKVPTLVLDDGRFLVDSTLIIDYLQTQYAGRSLMPEKPADYAKALQYVGVAMVGMEKVAQLVYETSQRPEDHQYKPWKKRLQQQLEGAVELIESALSKHADHGNSWLFGENLTQADITIAVTWRFIQHTECVNFEPRSYPALATYSTRAEALPQFQACPPNG